MTSSMSKYNKLYVLIFLLAGIAFFPYSYNSIQSIFSSSIRLFSLASLSALATCFVLVQLCNIIKMHVPSQECDIKVNSTRASGKTSFFRGESIVVDRRVPFFLIISISLFFIITIIQFFIFKNTSFDGFFKSIFWITIPLFIYFFSDSVTKFLPLYIYILWVADLLICFLSPGEKVGITGNRNWHAIFLVVVVMFSVYLTYQWIKYLVYIRRKPCVSTKKINRTQKRHMPCVSTYCIIAIIIIITAVFVTYSGYLFYKCESRAATLVIIIMLFVLIYLKSIDKLKIKLNKLKLRYYLIGLLILFISISILLLSSLYYLQTNKRILSSNNPAINIISILKDDVRFPLWEGAFNMIKDYPLSGTGPARFESVFASYRPLEYFNKPNSAVRSNHPHNTLLYIATSFGLPALILWCFLWIYPMIYCFISYSKLTLFMRITLFAYFCLFFHGLFDLVLFHWPTIYLAGIFLGLLWKETCKWQGAEGREQKSVVSGQWSVVGKREGEGVEGREQRAEGREQGEEVGGKWSVVGEEENAEHRTLNAEKRKGRRTKPADQGSVGVQCLCSASNQFTVNSEQEIKNGSKCTAPCRDTRCVSKSSISQTKNLNQYNPKPEACYLKLVASTQFFRNYLLFFKILIYSTVILIFTYTLNNLYLDYKSAYFLQIGSSYANKSNDKTALFYYQKGIDFKKVPKYIYKAGMLSTKSLNNPELALYFFNMLNQISFSNYAHSNAFTALNLIKLGKVKAALPYLIKEVVNYPLSVGAWYRLSLIQRQLNMQKEARFSLKNMRFALTAKGLPTNALELILKNPKYDSHPEKIPKEILDKLQNDSTKK